MRVNISTRSVLKRFVQLKFNKGIILRKYYKDDKEKIVWFYVPEKVVFKNYKTSKLRYQSSVKNLRMMNELICTKLAEQIGLKSAVYKPASYKGVKGLVSYNFIRTNEEKLDTIAVGSLSELEAYLDDRKQSGYKFDLKQITDEFFRLIILDCLTLQVDRHCFNVMLLANKEDKSVRLGNVFDCEFAFGADMFFGIEKSTLEDFGVFNDKFKFEKVIDKYDLSLIFKTIISEGYDCLTCVPMEHSDKYFKNRVFDCCEYAKYHNAMDVLLDVLKKVDVKKAIEELKKEGIEIGEYANYVHGFVNYTKKQFGKQLSLKNNKTNSKSKEGLEK